MAIAIGGGINIGGGVSVGAESGGGGGGFVSGNMTVGNGGPGNTEWGWKQGNYGSVTFADFPTGPSVLINYDSSVANRTLIQLFDGTYGAIVVNGTLGTVNGETSATVTIDGIVQTGTWFASGGLVQLDFVGDVFSLQSKNGQTLAVNMDAGL